MPSTTVVIDIPAFEREIKYDRITKDFALYLNGSLVGYAGSYNEGETRLDELAAEILAHQTQKAA